MTSFSYGKPSIEFVGADTIRPSTQGVLAVNDGGLSPKGTSVGRGQAALQEDKSISYISEQKRQRKEKQRRCYISAKFFTQRFTRGVLVRGDSISALKEVLKSWVSNGVSFGTFLSLMKEKYEHSRVNPFASLRSAPPFTQGRL